MKQTRVRILKETAAWIKDPDSLQICWITGMAGTGKTSIAKTVCEQANADTDIMLGGSFFCSRSSGLAAQRDIRCVIPTLSRLLARDSVDFRLALAETIHDEIQHKEVSAQVELLLRTPLSTLKDLRVPILFVIDALDECGGETTDGMLDDAMCHAVVTSMLEALVSLTRSDPKLPVKFLVTSRPEAQIRDTSISNDKLSQILRLHTVDVTEVSADIRRYITETLDTKLFGKPKLRASIPDSDVDDLVQLCDGLFIVAATAIAHTFGMGAAAAVSKFKRLLNASRSNLNERAAAPLDRMYEIILSDATTADESDATELQALQSLLASLLSARMTLSVTALADLLNLEPYNVNASLSQLHAVVHVPEDDDMPGLRTVHASFGDYLYSRAPSHIRIRQSLGHDALAHACFRVMGRNLRFNISASHSSYEPNPPGRPDSITLSLEYACMHWVYHFAALVDTGSLDTTIGMIFRPRFLYWLEVMSVLRQVWRAASMLFIAAGTVNTHAPSDLARFLRDANSFVVSSYEAIERSAPHIYISALPFADKDSLVYQEFALRCTGLVTVTTFGIGQHEGRIVMTLAGHDGAVSSVSYCPHGRILASGSEDGTVRIWDTRTGEEAMSPMCGGGGKVMSVAFSRNGKLVASGTESGAVWVCNVTPGQGRQRKLSGHSGPVNSVAFSSDGSRLASGSSDKTICLWNAETSEQIAVQSGHTDVVSEIAFSPDGKILASISDDGKFRQWDITGRVADEQLIQPVSTRHSHFLFPTSRIPSRRATYCCSIAFSPDGEMLARTDYTGKTVELHRYKTEIVITKLHSGTTICSVRFSPDGRLLVAACGRAVRLWTLDPDPQQASRVDLGGHGGMVNCATFSPDGLHIASASDDGTIRIWSTRSGQPTIQQSPVHEDIVRSVVVSHDSAFIFSGSDDKSVRAWDARTGDMSFPSLCEQTRSVSSVSISPDGRLIASGLAVTLAQAKAAARAEAKVEVEAMTLAERQTWVHSLTAVEGEECTEMWAVASDDFHMMAQRELAKAQEMLEEARAEALLWVHEEAKADHTIRLWDTQSGAAFGEPMHGHTSYIMAVTFSHDGRWLASASGDKTVYIWDVATQQALTVGPLGCQREAATVAFSPDDGLVAAGDISGRIYLWRTDTGEQAHKPLHADINNVWSLAFSPDGTKIVSGGNENAARIWDINTGQCILVLQGHTKTVWSVAWSPDGRIIGTGSKDATLRLWDPVTGEPLATLHGHTKAVRSVAFTRDGQFIISGSEDTTIRKWDVLMASKLLSDCGKDPVSTLASATLKDGWLVGSSGELISWVPAEYCKHLVAIPCTLWIAKSCVSIGVGESGLHAGVSWTSCWRG